MLLYFCVVFYCFVYIETLVAWCVEGDARDVQAATRKAPLHVVIVCIAPHSPPSTECTLSMLPH